VNPDIALEQSRLRVEVVSARIRLQLIEQQHERALVLGSPPEVAEIGREYAAAIHEHSNAVMAWLSSIAKYGYEKYGQEPGSAST
jgi:hypothetical protein